MNVAVVGCGQVGTVTAACLASIGHQVRGLEADAARAAQLASGQLPFHEPGLAERCRDGLARGRLRFTSDPATAITAAELIFLSVGTPPTPSGDPDVSQLRAAAAEIGPHLRSDAVIVTKSTVPVGCGDWLLTELEGTAPQSWGRAIVANPEFLREGSAVQDFLCPDRVVLGGEPDAMDRVERAYDPLLPERRTDGSHPGVFRMDRTSAELVKYAANAALATKISFANEIAALCELTGADARAVLPAVGADRRIGADAMRPGLGWGGSCFPKDVAALIATGREYGFDAKILEAARTVNETQIEAVLTKLRTALKRLKGRRIALLGLAFKPDTDDVRASPAVSLARALAASGARVAAVDPVVKALPETIDGVEMATDPYEAAARADAVVVATDWPQFADLDAGSLARCMDGRLVVDPRNVLDPIAMTDAGLRIVGTGWSA